MKAFKVWKKCYSKMNSYSTPIVWTLSSKSENKLAISSILDSVLENGNLSFGMSSFASWVRYMKRDEAITAYMLLMACV